MQDPANDIVPDTLQRILLEDARRGLEDVLAGRTEDADAGIARLQAARTANRSTSHQTKRQSN